LRRGAVGMRGIKEIGRKGRIALCNEPFFPAERDRLCQEEESRCFWKTFPIW
jgi:hypothetical protein